MPDASRESGRVSIVGADVSVGGLACAAFSSTAADTIPAVVTSVAIPKPERTRPVTCAPFLSMLPIEDRHCSAGAGRQPATPAVGRAGLSSLYVPHRVCLGLTRSAIHY